jgi:hypothetical protein
MGTALWGDLPYTRRSGEEAAELLDRTLLLFHGGDLLLFRGMTLQRDGTLEDLDLLLSWLRADTLRCDTCRLGSELIIKWTNAGHILSIAFLIPGMS